MERGMIRGAEPARGLLPAQYRSDRYPSLLGRTRAGNASKTSFTMPGQLDQAAQTS